MHPAKKSVNRRAGQFKEKERHSDLEMLKERNSVSILPTKEETPNAAAVGAEL